MRQTIERQVWCPTCGRWWCVGSNLGFLGWVVVAGVGVFSFFQVVLWATK